MQETAGLEKAARAEGRVLPNQSEVMDASLGNRKCPSPLPKRHDA